MPRRSPSKSSRQPKQTTKQQHGKHVPKSLPSTETGAASCKLQTTLSSTSDISQSSQAGNSNESSIHVPHYIDDVSTITVNPEILEFFLLNIQGINPSIPNQRIKIKQLEEDVNTSKTRILFFALTETHLNSSIFNAEIQIKNYNIIRTDREERKQGGTAIYLHNSLSIDEEKHFSDTHTEATMIHMKKSNVTIVVIYRAPNTPPNSYRNCLETVGAFIKKYESSDVIMMGDYNFRFLDWQTESINKTGIPTDEQEQATLTIQFTHQHLLTQMVEENTRKNKSILDLILISDPDMIHNIQTETTTMSDHDVVRCNFIHNTLQNVKETSTRSFQQKHPLDNLNTARADWSAINEEFDKVDWDTVINDNDSVEQMYKSLDSKITEICSKYTPVRTRLVQRNSIPNDRLALIRRKKRLNSKINIRKYVRVNVPKNQIDKLEKKKADVEEKIRSSIRMQNTLQEINAIEKIKSNPKMFFSYVKKFNKSESKIGPLADEDGTIHSDAKKKAELLQKQYTKAFSNPDKASTDHIKPNEDRTYPTLNDITFTPENVEKAIESIPNSAAPGPDKLPAIILKQCKKQLSYPIYKIWRKSLDTGEIPEILKTQGIVPIFKKGNKSSAANYRPVSLTSHLIKLFEKILRAKIVIYIEENNILTNQQHGFRRHRSCLTQLLVHIDNILYIVGNDSNADVIYLDFAKAFDKVDHKILLHKLQNIGIQGKIYNWIKNFLQDRKQKVIVDGEASEPASVKSGVPQGTVLGPILFLLFINDITEAIKYANIQLFADDSKISMEIKNSEDHKKLQQDLEAAIMWALLNNMMLNEDKFMLIQYGSNKELKQDYTISTGNNLKNSTEIKDLGVIVSEDLAWLKHITAATNEGKKFAAWILRSFQTRNKIILQLFKTFVISKLEYAAPLWMPYLKKDIEKVESLQRTFTNRIDGLEDLNYHDRLKALNLYSLQRRRERFCMITMWKISQNLHPNQLDLEFYETHRFGVKCRRKQFKTKKVHIKTIQHNSFSSIGPALFNCIPRRIKEKETLTSFKAALDKFLKSIPDTPPLSGYPTVNGNSILDWAGGGHYSLFDDSMARSDEESNVQNHGDAAVTVDAPCM